MAHPSWPFTTFMFYKFILRMSFDEKWAKCKLIPSGSSAVLLVAGEGTVSLRKSSPLGILQAFKNKSGAQPES